VPRNQPFVSWKNTRQNTDKTTTYTNEDAALTISQSDHSISARSKRVSQIKILVFICEPSTDSCRKHDEFQRLYVAFRYFSDALQVIFLTFKDDLKHRSL